MFYLLKRNDWVCNQKIKLLFNNRKKYDKLPSYDYMFCKFWIWDINKFIKENNQCIK